MPSTGKRWRHVIVSTRCSWLHGDPRGFRSRKHRIHSSGDYKNPPPRGEHKGLFVYHDVRDGEEVHIPPEARATVGQAIVHCLRSQGHRVVAVAVAKVHGHSLVELPDDMRVVRATVGEAKRKSSRAVKDLLPGSVWSAGGTYKPVDNRGHLHSSYGYILYDQGPEAWTWSFRDGSDQGTFGRTRPTDERRKRASKSNRRGG